MSAQSALAHGKLSFRRASLVKLWEAQTASVRQEGFIGGRSTGRQLLVLLMGRSVGSSSHLAPAGSHVCPSDLAKSSDKLGIRPLLCIFNVVSAKGVKEELIINSLMAETKTPSKMLHRTRSLCHPASTKR